MDPAKSNEVYVTHLTTVEVTSETQVADLLPKAAKARAVAATLCNEQSSRSHSLFRLKISGQNSKTGEECEGATHTVQKLKADLSVAELLRREQQDSDVPNVSSVQETLCSLRFAAKVNQCQIGTAKKITKLL